MFVRTGTVRKNRGAASRRHAPKHRRDSNEHNVAARKSTIFEDPSSTGSAVYGLSPNGDIHVSRSVSLHSFTYKTELENENQSNARVEVVENESSLCNPYKSTINQDYLTVKPSPARSHTTTVVVCV
jgi:hypothetical protein